MGKEVFINYWIGEHLDPNPPNLNQIPSYVDIVPLAFLGIDPTTYLLNFDFLTQFNTAATLQGWIKELQAHGTKVLFSINDWHLGFIPSDKQQDFINDVVDKVNTWGVDGIDFDYEPSGNGVDIFSSKTYIPLIKALRKALKPGSVFTAPIYSPWIQGDDAQNMLKELGGVVDYISTMDYSAYIGYDETLEACKSYASYIGGWDRLIIGMNNLKQDTGFWTPIEDVARLSAYKPPDSRKGGSMLYTYTYDIKQHTGLPDGTFTETIHKNLPISGDIN